MITVTDEKLINLAGETTFKRGLKLYQSDAVIQTEKLKNHILATVTGTQLYTVDLTINQQRMEGACSCPASDYMDFCKHCVAVALTLKAEQEITTQIKQSNHKYAPIESYIATLSKQRLQTELSKLILADSTLKMHWLAKAESALGLLDYKTLRKKITAAIPYNRHLHYYDLVRNYFAKVELLAQQLQDSEETLSPEETFKLTEYALQRINKALETIDDSGGFRLESQIYFSDLLLHSFTQINWSASQKADWLITLSQSCVEIFPSIAENFWPLLSLKEQTVLVQQIQLLWDSLAKPNTDDYEQRAYVQSLQDILVEHAKSKQQFDTVIQLHEKTASYFYEHIHLLKLEITYQFFENAEVRLIQFRKQFTETQEIQELYEMEALLAEKQQQYERMLNALWSHYAFKHSLPDLQNIITLAEQHQNTVDWITKAEQLLLKQANEPAPPPPALWHWQPFTHLAELYLAYGKSTQALNIMKEQKISDSLALKIIRSPDLKLMDVWPTYQKHIVHQINLSNNKGYKSALKLMKEVLHRANSLSKANQEELEQWMLCTRDEFKRKRNFAKWFDEFWVKEHRGDDFY